MVRINQHAKFQAAIPSMRSPGNARKPQIWPVLLSKSDTKGGKSTERDHNLITSEGGQDTLALACKISGHSVHAFSRKCLVTYPDGQMDRPQNGHGWSDEPTDPCIGGKSVFQVSDGRMDGWRDNLCNASSAYRVRHNNLWDWGMNNTWLLAGIFMYGTE